MLLQVPDLREGTEVTAQAGQGRAKLSNICSSSSSYYQKHRVIRGGVCAMGGRL